MGDTKEKEPKGGKDAPPKKIPETILKCPGEVTVLCANGQVQVTSRATGGSGDGFTVYGAKDYARTNAERKLADKISEAVDKCVYRCPDTCSEDKIKNCRIKYKFHDKAETTYKLIEINRRTGAQLWEATLTEKTGVTIVCECW